MTQTLLRIDASARTAPSVTRQITSDIIAKLAPDTQITRDLAAMPLPQASEDWVTANFTDPDARTEAQKETLALSDRLVSELQSADTIVIGLPIYNFGMPAALKTWVDLIARAGVTFRYTADGPVGLLSGKRAIIAFAAGGVPAGSPVDFATPHLRQVLNFVGITDVTLITAADDVEHRDTSAQIQALAA